MNLEYLSSVALVTSDRSVQGQTGVSSGGIDVMVCEMVTRESRPLEWSPSQRCVDQTL